METSNATLRNEVSNTSIENAKKRISEDPIYVHLKSFDPNNWGTIIYHRFPVISSINTNCEVTITAVNVLNAIVILSTEDYITINNIKYNFTQDRTMMNSDTFVAILTNTISESGVIPRKTSLGLIEFYSNNSFTINECSYNVQMMLGYQTYPIKASFDNAPSELRLREPNKNSTWHIIMKSIGSFNSTNKLFITSNLGGRSFRLNEKLEMEGAKIFMTLNNSWRPGVPIVYSGYEQRQYISISEMSTSGYFTLVDSNLEPVKLLAPLEISLRIIPYYLS